MDAELLALQQQLESLQEEESAVRLSEANVVEIVQKLVASGRLQLLHTRDGSEYVTLEQLAFEIRDAVQAAGRVEVVKLQTLLNIDVDRIQRQVDQLLEQPQTDLRLVQGELMTQYYLDNVTLEVEEMLQSRGQLTVAQLSSRFQLSSAFVSELIATGLESNAIHGVFDNGTALYTDLFVRREKARLQGALAALTSPTAVSRIADLVPDMKQAIFQSLFDSMVAQKTLSGVIRGTLYIPTVFSIVSERLVTRFYEANGFLTYQRVSTVLKEDHPQSWLKHRFPKGVALATCMVDPRILEQVDVGIEEALVSDGWIELAALLPAPSLEEDVMNALARCKSYVNSPTKLSVLSSGHYLVTQRFLDSVAGELTEQYMPVCVTAYLTALAKQQAALLREKQEEEAEVEKVATESSSPLLKKKSSGKRSAVGNKKSKSLALPQHFFTQSSCASFLQTLHRSCDVEMLDAVCERFYAGMLPRMIQKCKLAESAQESSGKEASPKPIIHLSRKERERLAAHFSLISHNFSLFRAGVAVFSDQEETVSAMEKHLVRTTGMSLMQTCLRLEAGACGISLRSNCKLNEESERLEVISQFSGATKLVFETLNACVKDGALAPFEAALFDCAKLCKLQVAPFDKKLERQMMQGHRQGFLQQLEKESNPALAVHLACVALFAYHRKAILNIPSRWIGVVAAELVFSNDADRTILLSLVAKISESEAVSKQEIENLRSLVSRNKKSTK